MFAVCTAGCLLALPKYAAAEMSPVQITFLRYIAGVATITPFYLWQVVLERRSGNTQAREIRRGMLRWHVLRAVFAVTRLSCLFYAVTHMAFANAQAVTLTNSVFMIAFAAILLHERVRPVTIFAAAVCFAGGVIAAEPTFDADSFLTSGALAALAGAAIWGAESMVIKITADRDNIPRIVFIVNLLAGLLIALPGIYVWQPLTDAQWWMLLAMGPIAILTQSSNIRAFRAADASILAPFRYFSLAVALAIGWFVFNEWPSDAAFLGIALIFGGGLVLSWRVRDVRVGAA